MTLVKPPVVYLDDFRSETVFDRIVVVNQNPPAFQRHVPIDEDVLFEVIDLGSGTEVPSVVKVWMNGDLVYDAGFKVGYSGSTLSKTSSPGASPLLDVWKFRIVHAASWSSQEDVTMRVEATSTGLYSVIEEWTFTAADIEKPEVDSVVPSSPRSLRVTFNEPLLVSSVTASRFVLRSEDPPYYIPESFTVEMVNDDPAIWELRFDQELSNARDYLLDVSGVQDQAEPANTIDPVTVPFTSMAYPWPERRVWDLWSWVPRRIRWVDTFTGSSPGHTQYFIQCLQEIADLLLYDIDEDQYVYDPDRAPIGAVDLLLHYLYNPFKLALTALQKRKLLRLLPAIHQSKHADGLKDVIFLFLEIDVEIIPLTGASRSWRLAGSSTDPSPPYGKLGVSSYLRPPAGDPAYYTFKVVIPRPLTDEERAQMIQFIELMKAAHEHYVLDEPAAPTAGYWLIGKTGRGELGKTTTLGEAGMA